MFWNSTDEAVAIKHWSIVIHISWNNPDLRIPRQGRLEVIRLIVGKDVEVPDWPTPRVISVEAARQVDLTRVFVNDEGSIVDKLTG